MASWAKLFRGPETLDLLAKSPNAFALLTLIVIRVSREGNPLEGLKPGQAKIGDHKNCGLTRKQYRTSMDLLENLGIVSFLKTRKGTIATQLSTRILDANCVPENPLNLDQSPTENRGHQKGHLIPENGPSDVENGAIKGAIEIDDVTTETINTYDVFGTLEGHQRGHQESENGPSDVENGAIKGATNKNTLRREKNKKETHTAKTDGAPIENQPSPQAAGLGLPTEMVYWNSKPELSKALKFTPHRKRLLEKCRKDPFFVENFERAVDLVCKSAWLTGGNERGWTAHFEWLLRQDKVLEIIESQGTSAKRIESGTRPPARNQELKEGLKPRVVKV